MTALCWLEVRNAVLLLAKMLEGKRVYGIPRGGTLVASLLSYHGCEFVAPTPSKLHMQGWGPEKTKNVIIVDDIADTGKTLEVWQENGYVTAALFVRHSCAPLPNYGAVIIDTDDYVMFPWEEFEKSKEIEESGKFREHE